MKESEYMESKVLSDQAKLRYKSHRKDDVIYRTSDGLLYLSISEPYYKCEKLDGKIKYVKIGIYQQDRFIAEIEYQKPKPNPRIEGTYMATFGLSEVFETVEEAEQFLNKYIELSKFECEELNI